MVWSVQWFHRGGKLVIDMNMEDTVRALDMFLVMQAPSNMIDTEVLGKMYQRVIG